MSTQVQATLHVQWNGGGLAASQEKAPILVGRSADTDVHIDGHSVSREHLRLVLEEGGWFAVDQSTGGTYSPAGVRVERVPLGPEEVTLHLGAPDGPAVRLITAEPASGGPGSMPYVPPIDVGVAWTVATNDPTLRLEIDGRDYAFSPPGRVVIGRDPRCAVVCDNGLVSRQHVAFTSRGTGWWIEDLRSSRGTFIDGKRLRKPTHAQGAFIAMLGDEDAGERLQVVTAGTHKKPRKRSRLATALKAVAVAAVTVIGIALLARPDPHPEPPDDPDPVPSSDVANTRDQLDLAATATVRITILDEEGEIAGTGSGAVVSPEGLILTNAHVADPSQRGVSQDEFPEAPAGFGIYVVSDRSSEAQPRYLAELVATHPTVDAALLRIIADENGDPPNEIETPVLPIGDSDQLVNGDEAHQFGFPGIAHTWEVSIAEVTIQSFFPLPSCSELPADWETLSCSAEGEVKGGLMNLTGGDLGPGSSGGPFVREGTVVGINVGAFSEETATQSYGIPVHTIRDWLTDNGVPI